MGDRRTPGVGHVRTDQPIIYYLHGSGYVICSTRTHRGLTARSSNRTGRAVFSLDYRLGPRYRWPAAGDDTIRGYLWLLEQGFAPEQIVVAGDSAGGHLALDLLGHNQRTRTRSRPGSRCSPCTTRRSVSPTPTSAPGVRVTRSSRPPAAARSCACTPATPTPTIRG